MDHEARIGESPTPPIADDLSVIISRQDLSWQKGEPLSIDHLLDTLQSKSADGRELLDLICNEVYLRQQQGQSPKLEEYQQRFPAYAKAIEIQWKIDGFLADVVASDESTSRATVELEESVNHSAVTKLGSINETLRPTSTIYDVPPELLKHPSYRFKRPIGQGGMGTVWLAEQVSMQRMVAIKLIRPDLAAKPESITRFRRELQAVARLRHPNIVTAHDAGEFGDTHFLVFEYIDGLTLAKCVEKGPLAISDACSAVRDAAFGLAHAHAAGLVHRDIKPGNLIRDVDGVVKVLDFGLVVEPSDDSSITGENIIMGTLDYISPEQANDPRLADARSDVYSLGCTLYHLLSGAAPFKGLSPIKKLDAQRFAIANPIPGVTQDLNAIVAKMMAKRPEDRYQSASEVIAAITPFCSPGRSQPHTLPSATAVPSTQPLTPPTTKLFTEDMSRTRLPRRVALATGFGAVGILLANLWVRSGKRPADKILRTIALTEPSSFGDAGDKAFTAIDRNRLTLNAVQRYQVWLNYQQIRSNNLEIVASFRILEISLPEPIVKFNFLSCQGDDFHEFSVQFRMRESIVELFRTSANGKDELLADTKMELKIGETKDVRFRMDKNGLKVTVDGKQLMQQPCVRTNYFACVAALHCSVELFDSQINEIAQ